MKLPETLKNIRSIVAAGANVNFTMKDGSVSTYPISVLGEYRLIRSRDPEVVVPPKKVAKKKVK